MPPYVDEIESNNIRESEDSIVSQRDCVNCDPVSHSAVTSVKVDINELQQACKQAISQILVIQNVIQKVAKVVLSSGINELEVQNIEQDSLSAYNLMILIQSCVLSLQSKISMYQAFDDVVNDSQIVDVGAILEVPSTKPSESVKIDSKCGLAKPRRHAKSSLSKMSFASRKIYREHSYDLRSPATIKRKFVTLSSALDSNTKKLKVMKQKSKRLHVRITTLSNMLQGLNSKNLLSEDAMERIKASFSHPVQSLLLRQLINCKQHVKAQYPPELRVFALTLQFYSKPAYLYVRKLFNKKLPHPKTLAKWYSCIDGNPGFQDEVFHAISEMTQCGGGQMLCSLMMDEMAIRRQIDWDGKRFVGYVDMGVPVKDNAGYLSCVRHMRFERCHCFYYRQVLETPFVPRP